MITDFAMSLSRKKEDKERGTGRFHIMKNRYGTDGLTFNVNADTSTGHFVLSAYNEDDEDDDMPKFNQIPAVKGPVDNWDKKALKSTTAYEAFFKTENK